MCDITDPIFTNADKAREHLESIRWPDGAVCPHCKAADNRKLVGKSHRPGLYQCNHCRQQFSVTVGTVFERSKVPLNKWLLAVHLMAASKKGMSAHQLHRMLGVTYKTAWFMAHRIREAMTEGMFTPMGGDGDIVEVDETFIGHDKTKKPKGVKKGRGYQHKYKVLTLVERQGRARSFHVDEVNAKTIVPILRQEIDRKSHIMTDEAGQYKHLKGDFGNHDFVRHGQGEYGRGPIHTNTIEGYFSIFKRGMKGVYQHCAKHHLHRYLAEFDFRYNGRDITDVERRDEALRSISGKRLTYRRINETAYA
ncbi:IS1595 family transposase [Emcibacter sp.]|uniref:IS1595 family transposase n=1 Tax=Emcibacter sp. TaxID=1979954 RepID=UPI002AA77F41|nr:IS1595 family transposase [Emcibacter sp.]